MATFIILAYLLKIALILAGFLLLYYILKTAIKNGIKEALADKSVTINLKENR